MSIAGYIKVIGRGKQGARPLPADQAADLLGQILDKQVTDLEVGAFCLAMRIKGETTTELEGFLRAVYDRATPLTQAAKVAGRGIVVLPSYNGARKLPNLTPLLAAALAQRGARVLVHGPSNDPARVTSAEIFAQAQLPVVRTDSELAQAWTDGQPAFMDVVNLCAPLDDLLAVRWTVGLRNPAHTVAKLLNPFDVFRADGIRSMQVVNHTHREYADSLTDYLQHAQAHAMLMRGTEGEPVADARRQPKFDVFMAGAPCETLSQDAEAGVLAALPDLPAGHTAAETAEFVRMVLAGERAMPASLKAQVDCLVACLDAQVT